MLNPRSVGARDAEVGLGVAALLGLLSSMKQTSPPSFANQRLRTRTALRIQHPRTGARY